jgi:hypothetical protein
MNDMAMRVKMLKNQPGSADGINVRLYEEGEVYTVPNILGRLFLEMKAAEQIEEQEMMRGAPTDEDIGSAPLDKDVEEEELDTSDEVEPVLEVTPSDVAAMSKKDKKALKKRVQKMNREQLEQLIAHNELQIPHTSHWRDDTVAMRTIEALGL